MARTPWTPTSEQVKHAKAWTRKLRRRDALIEECLRDLAELVDDQQVQASWLIEESKVERKRFYRDLERGREKRAVKTDTEEADRG